MFMNQNSISAMNSITGPSYLNSINNQANNVIHDFNSNYHSASFAQNQYPYFNENLCTEFSSPFNIDRSIRDRCSLNFNSASSASSSSSSPGNQLNLPNLNQIPSAAYEFHQYSMMNSLPSHNFLSNNNFVLKQNFSQQNIPTTNGKTRTKDKYRVVYNDFQRIELEKQFLCTKFITNQRKLELSQLLNLSERQIKIWFQNRRAKERKIDDKKDSNDCYKNHVFF